MSHTLSQFIVSFNQENFFEAHDILEAEWRKIEGHHRDFLKGLIQAAVACHHLQQKNNAGALKMLASSLGHLRYCLPTYQTIDTEQLVNGLFRLQTDLEKSHTVSIFPKINRV